MAFAGALLWVVAFLNLWAGSATDGNPWPWFVAAGLYAIAGGMMIGADID